MLDSSILNEVKNLIGDGLTCPANIQGLNEIIELKNKLTKQLNNLYTKIDSIKNIVDPLVPVIDGVKSGIKGAEAGIDALAFIPSTATTPIPVGPILKLIDVIAKIKPIIGKSEGTIATGESSLDIITSQITKVTDLLSMVDLFIGICSAELSANNEGGTLATQTAVSNELLRSTQEQSNQLSPVVTNVNGFEMAVVSIGEEVGGLKRRQAVARNSQGIVMLQGDPSFSSNDQILIDELVFYIKQNDLKA